MHREGVAYCRATQDIVELKRSVLLLLVMENVGNFLKDASMVMRLSRDGVGCNFHIFVCWFSYDHPIEVWRFSSRFLSYPLTARENCTSNRRQICMKTLNLTLRTILLALALVSTVTSALAYDMKVNGVCYNINGNEAIVTYFSYSYSDGYNKYNKYSGHITIPETVTYNGLTYSVTRINGGAFAN